MSNERGGEPDQPSMDAMVALLRQFVALDGEDEQWVRDVASGNEPKYRCLACGDVERCDDCTKHNHPIR